MDESSDMDDEQRQQHVIDTLESAFADLMAADPRADHALFVEAFRQGRIGSVDAAAGGAGSG